MNKLEGLRRLPLVAACAALAAVSISVQAEVQTLSQNPIPQVPYESAAKHTQAEPLAISQVQPTPEQLGDALMGHKRYQAAIEAYKKAPLDSAGVWNKMGIAYQLMLDPEDAAACYRKSLKLDRRNANVLNNLGTIFDAQKRYHDAEGMYRAALRSNPGSAVVLKNLGTALLAEHKYKKGWAVYKEALAIDPHIFDQQTGPKVQDPASLQDRGAMNYYMAKGCARAGMTDCAINYLRLALNEGFTNPRKLAEDSEFAGMRESPAFQELMRVQKNP